MGDHKLPVVSEQASAETTDIPVTPDILTGGWPLLDGLPFPVLEIRPDYQIARVNPAAARVYGATTGTCYALSHGLDQPCDQSGETCPKLEADRTGAAATVRHAHQTSSGVESHLVIAHPLTDGGVLEMHIPLEDTLARDSLTGLYQRDFFDQLIVRQIALLNRMKLGYAIVLIDVDHFKKVNDTYGHALGDQVLEAVGQTLRKQKREGDSIARWGGEEICVFLPDSDLGGANTQAKRIQQAIRTLLVPTSDGAIAVTVSIGVAMALPRESIASVIERADHALYRAKNSGRDQIQLSSGPEIRAF